MTEQVDTAHESPAPLDAGLVSARFLRLVPRDFARAHLLVSQGEEGDTERLAIAPATRDAAIWNVGVRLRARTKSIAADPAQIARVIDQAYAASGAAAGGGDVGVGESSIGSDTPGSTNDVDALIQAADRDLLSAQGKGPIVKLVDLLLFEALSRKASDVHIQPLSDRTLVRYRLDGMLVDARELPASLSFPVISRVKVMGKMDIAESRVAQDGRATVTIGERPIDLRISTLPTSYGERTVIRLLDNSNQLCTLEEIGMPHDVARHFLERASAAHGIVLLTGPTGSGKTTTLYATLRKIGSPALNLMTIEDPIEYELSTVGLAISQAQVNAKKGVTFATGLRHILRQDPDVVMVGEIRDGETARVALQASLTGHLVFSTLHTNDSASAITRLFDLGLEPYLVSASLSAVLAQRLVRRLHRDCQGGGCAACFHSGFLGRTGLFELLVVDPDIRELINRSVPLSEIRARASEHGTESLLDQGMRLVREGVTTQAEVLRVVQGAQ